MSDTAVSDPRRLSNPDIALRDLTTNNDEIPNRKQYRRYLILGIVITFFFLGFHTVEIVAGVVEPDKSVCMNSTVPWEGSESARNLKNPMNASIGFGSSGAFLMLFALYFLIRKIYTPNTSQMFKFGVALTLILIFSLSMESVAFGWIYFGSMIDSLCSNFLIWIIFTQAVISTIIVILGMILCIWVIRKK